MVVSELIKLLEQCDQSNFVYIESPDRDRDFFCDGVRVDGTDLFIQTAE